jgi:hypothetical protein
VPVRRKKDTGRSRLIAWVKTKPESVFHPTDAAKALDLAVATVRKYLREMAHEGYVFPIQEDGNWRRCVDWDPEPEPEPVERKAPAENSVRVAKRRARKLAAEDPKLEVPYELKSKILKSFGDSEAQQEFRKRIESRRDRIAGIRSGNNRGGTVLNMNVEETLLEVFLRNREGGGGLPDHDNPNNVRECLDDMQLARWLSKEFPQNRRNYNSWLKAIPPIRAVYHRGKLVMQLRDEKGGVDRPYPPDEVLESPQYVAGEPQPIIRRPRRKKNSST